MSEQGQADGVQMRRGASARARADERRAVRARTNALARIADEWDALGSRLERAAKRRDVTIERAREKADARYVREEFDVEQERVRLVREALALEGASTKEIAQWLGLSSRKVNSLRVAEEIAS